MTPAAAKGRIWAWSKELTMTSINDIADLVQILQDHPEWRNTIRALIVGEELANMPNEVAIFVKATNENFNLVHQQFEKVDQRLERLETDVAEIKTDVATLKEDVSRMDGTLTRMDGTLTRVDGTLTRMDGTLTRMDGTLTRVGGTVTRMGRTVSRLIGEDYESHVATYVHRFLSRSLGINASVFSTQRDKSALTGLLDEAEKQGVIEAEETDELDKADLILTTDGPTDYILAEVSITIQQDDIDRAAERARLFAKATARTVAPVAIGAREDTDLQREHVQIIFIPEPPSPST